MKGITYPLLIAGLFAAVSASECGKRYFNQDLDALQHWVVGGVTAVRGAYPYQVSLELYDWMYGSEHLCGATLVASKWIVTAAHCLLDGTKASSYRVVVGRHDFKAYERSMRRVGVRRVIMHPQYTGDYNDDLSNDIALMELKTSVSFNNYVQPACLPEKSQAARIYAPGRLATISGWGEMDPKRPSDESQGRSPSRLRAARVPIIEGRACRAANPDYAEMLTEAMVCAGYMEGKIDGCQGDSGGPLVEIVDGKATLVGVVSWGLGCAQKNYPGVYTNVVYELDWIRKYIRE